MVLSCFVLHFAANPQVLHFCEFMEHKQGATTEFSCVGGSSRFHVCCWCSFLRTFGSFVVVAVGFNQSFCDGESTLLSMVLLW